MRSERWATENQIMASLSRDDSQEKGGPILYHSRGQNWKYTDEKNGIFLGLTGVGKSRRGMMPMVRSLIESKESYIVVDPKGEIYSHTSCYADKQYNKHVIDFRHVFESEHYNPLAAAMEHFSSGDPNRKQLALEMIDNLAYTLYPVAEKSDPFWNDSARSVFIGTVYALMSLGDPKNVTLASAYQFIARGEESAGLTKAINLFVNNLDKNSISSMLLQGYINTANDTKAGIRSSYLDGLSIFARSEGLISMLSSDDLHINDLDGEKPTAIYIILPDESPIFDSIAGVICSQLMNHYVQIAQDRYNGRLPRRLNILLEELGNIGSAIPSLPHLMSAGRSRNIRCFLVLQSLSQLDAIYGTSDASTIKSNADLLIAFRTNQMETLKELSDQCGERESVRENQVIREPLITPSQLAAMETGQALIMISGRMKFISWIPDYSELFDDSQWEPPKRKDLVEYDEVPIFDIKEYIHNMDSSPAPTPHESKILPLPKDMVNPLIENVGTDIPSSIIPDGDIDGLIEKINNEIDDLIEQRKSDQQENEENNDKETHIALINSYDKASEIANILKKYTGLPEKDIRKMMKKMPCSFLIGSRSEAEKALCEINQAGGFAMFGNVVEDWCS